MKGGIFLKVREMLDIIDATKENDAPEGLKIRWLNDVEGRVMCEVCRAMPESVKSIVSLEDELCVPEAYSMLYVLYVVSMIEFTKGDYSDFARLTLEFEKAFELYARWYIRNS